eukprot:1081859-Pyramimonas_sp.AAC.1
MMTTVMMTMIMVMMVMMMMTTVMLMLVVVLLVAGHEGEFNLRNRCRSPQRPSPARAPSLAT